MNTPNKSSKPGDSNESPKPQSADCGSDCSCHATGKPGKTRWVVGVIVLAAAGVLAARAMIKTGVVTAKAVAPAFASPTLASDVGTATNSGAAASAAITSAATSIETLSELNTVAAKPDAVFVFLPGKDGVSIATPTVLMQNAARTIESRTSLKCGLFMLKADSPDYDKLAGNISFPCILAMVKGRGMSAVSGDITETKLVQGFVAASSAGGCSGGTCAPGTPGCN